MILLDLRYGITNLGLIDDIRISYSRYSEWRIKNKYTNWGYKNQMPKQLYF